MQQVKSDELTTDGCNVWKTNKRTPYMVCQCPVAGHANVPGIPKSRQKTTNQMWFSGQYIFGQTCMRSVNCQGTSLQSAGHPFASLANQTSVFFLKIFMSEKGTCRVTPINKCRPVPSLPASLPLSPQFGAENLHSWPPIRVQEIFLFAGNLI